MGSGWSNWADRISKSTILPMYQDRNVEWSRCTHVILILLWKIYFCWVFGLKIFSRLLVPLHSPDCTSVKPSMIQDGERLYLCWYYGLQHIPLLVTFVALVIFNLDICKVQTFWKVFYLDMGFSYVFEFPRLNFNSLVFSAFSAHITSYIIRQIALELTLLVGSHSMYYVLVFDSSRITLSDDTIHKGRIRMIRMKAITIAGRSRVSWRIVCFKYVTFFFYYLIRAGESMYHHMLDPFVVINGRVFPFFQVTLSVFGNKSVIPI